MGRMVNRVIKILITSDFFLNCGWGLLSPVFAIFIVQKIAVGSPSEGAKIAGFAAFVYWVSKSLLQVPIGRYLDKDHGEIDDFWFMVFGTFLSALSPLGFLISTQPWHIYAFQVVHGVAMAFVVPSWSAIFTRHIDKDREAFEWSLESTFLGIAAGVTGAIGGLIAALFGFSVVFILVSFFNMISVFLLLSIKNNIFPTDHRFPRVPPIKPGF